jgi:hypothetical protein
MELARQLEAHNLPPLRDMTAVRNLLVRTHRSQAVPDDNPAQSFASLVSVSEANLLSSVAASELTWEEKKNTPGMYLCQYSVCILCLYFSLYISMFHISCFLIPVLMWFYISCFTFLGLQDFFFLPLIPLPSDRSHRVQY